MSTPPSATARSTMAKEGAARVRRLLSDAMRVSPVTLA